MPAMVVLASVADEALSELVGSTISMAVAAKTVSLRPRVTPAAGFCWHPASRATKTMSVCVSSRIKVR